MLLQKGFGHYVKIVEGAQDVTKNKVANYRSHKEQYPKTDNRQLRAHDIQWIFFSLECFQLYSIILQI